jgi:HlyD family secretion protein
LNGRVRLVEPAAFLKVSALGVEEQRVNVIADFTDPLEKRQQLGDEYRVEARVVVWEADDVVKVPAGALFRGPGGGWAVFAVRDGRVRLTAVDVGRSNGIEAEVRAGLTPGDRVVSHPSDRVKDGVKVVGR